MQLIGLEMFFFVLYDILYYAVLITRLYAASSSMSAQLLILCECLRRRPSRHI